MKRSLHLACGCLLFLLTIVLVPETVLPFGARTALGTMLWMGWWWIAMPVDPAITALLPIVINALFGLVPMEAVTSLYFSDIVVLLLGASIISAIWEITGLDRRLAIKSLLLLGPSVKTHLCVWFLVCVALSSVLPNAVVCALMIPICVAMLRFLESDGTRIPKALGYILMLAIVWGCSLGGIGTPLGGAMNLVAVSYLEQLIGHEYFYMDWVKNMAPMMAVLVSSTLLFLILARPKTVVLGKTRAFVEAEHAKLPHISREELLGLALFAAPLILAFTRGFYAAWLPDLKPAHLFLVCGLLAFFFNGKDGEPLLTWKTACPRIEWQLLLLFAGGLALGKLLTATGVTKAVATAIAEMQLGGGFIMLAVVAAITMVFVEVASNTAAAAIVVPMVISLAQETGLDPVACVYVTAGAFNTGFMFPTSIRAIPVAYGLDPRFLFRHGLVMAAITIVLVASVGLVLYF